MSSISRRALVVDDSRSARVILSRLLEGYGMQVDTAESGEQALEYVNTTRPDVIFMDHLMPGMDGFEAVRALKSNPRTQSIPVMMYSSQDGPEYLRQALTSGAVGVLPKTLTQTDVSRALYQLHLLPDRREASDTLPRVEQRVAYQRDTHIESDAHAVTPARHQQTSSSPPMQDVHAAVTSMLKTYDADLRHALHNEFAALTQRLLESQRATPSSGDASVGASATADASMPWTEPASAPPRRGMWGVVFAAAIAVVVLAWLAYDGRAKQLQLKQVNTQLNAALLEQQRQIDALRSELLQHSTNNSANANAGNEMVPVPYGEASLAGPRILAVRDRIIALQTSGFKGTVQITRYVGDFCLSGSAVTGFALAAAAMSMRRCDLIGNPFEDGLSEGAHQSTEFNNMLAMITRNGTEQPQVRIVAGGRKPASPYPVESEAITAGEWNKIAAANNRIEIALIPQNVQQSAP
jgi:CheY-like chemotaxis protein